MSDTAHLDALERSYAASRQVIATITDDDLGRPTPCPEWDIRALLNHYVNALSMFPVMLAGGQPDWTRQLTMGDRLATFDAAVEANLAAWRVPGAIDTPASMLAPMRLFDMNLIDAVVHTWDLATAIDVEPNLDDDAVALAFARWQQAPLDTSRQFGAFGPEVAVPADAPVLDRLLGLVGRTPG